MSENTSTESETNYTWETGGPSDLKQGVVFRSADNVPCKVTDVAQVRNGKHGSAKTVVTAVTLPEETQIRVTFGADDAVSIAR
ncbi:hypothetical protein [Streptomyces sp. NBC_00160]|uniref:hypothetical protein n=1 Tax=Streptomyces TaxID=1883 RepID=UPI00338FC041